MPAAGFSEAAKKGMPAVVNVSATTEINTRDTIALTRYAADLGADMIVMGAYGHSRMTELILGGVTQTLLESMTVPVLMSR